MFPVIWENIFRTAMLGPKIYDLARQSKLNHSMFLKARLGNKLQKDAHVAMINIHLKVVRFITHK